ncbi:MAG: alpha-amylase family glycosyl hydrolase [Candidatus Nanopelagicales bacterium]
MRRPLVIASAALGVAAVALGAFALRPQPEPAPFERLGLSGERVYFVMPDRFIDGDPSNNTGGLTGDRSTTGYDPADYGFFHGGDLAGLTQRLDYIGSLGTTALWLTPVFANKPVQGTGFDESAGYHGYWTLDYTRIDPHLGTNAEMRALVDAAHARGMKVFFDIVVNHTADVITSPDGPLYVSKEEVPYKDASGNPFDDAKVAGSPDFPPLNLDSFPLRPVVPAGERDAKAPAWLNDPTMYHNRGDSTFQGESSQYGDFFGLDDLFTERPEVVDGMTQIAEAWIDEMDIDGYRLDTAKHVNTAFWQAFAPRVLEHAKQRGKKDFILFGEVYDPSPAFLSEYTTNADLSSVLDFGFQQAARSFAAGGGTDGMRDLFDQDDYYTDADSDAYSLVTFLGNHDMGRIGSFLRSDLPDAADDEILKRDLLAHSLLYLSRGNPTVYYGDEQGFAAGTVELLTGSLGDKDAREDMGPTKVESYADNDLIGSDDTPADDNARPEALKNPIAVHLAALSALLEANPALRTGAQIHRLSSPDAGVYAFSRIDASQRQEYVVALNNATEDKQVTVPTSTPGTDFAQVFPASDTRIPSGDNGDLTITVPALSAVVLRADGDVPVQTPTSVTLAPLPTLAPEAVNLLEATVQGSSFARVTFEVREAGAEEWRTIGVDDNPAFRLYWSARDYAPGTTLEIRATARGALDEAGVSAVVTATVGGAG